MEIRLRLPAAVIASLALMLAISSFAVADRLWLHWYTPDVGRLEAQIEDLQASLDTTNGNGAANAKGLASLRQDVAALKSANAPNGVVTGAIGRIATAVTINSLVANLAGTQRSDSPAGEACRNWLLLGVGSITDCGFTH